MKRSKKQGKTVNPSATAPSPPVSLYRHPDFLVRAASWLPLILALVAFAVYVPSLFSGFVYDARAEILEEGFITNPANLLAVLSLKVLKMHIMLWPRPGDLLYLMLIAVISGKHPFGYHLGSNLLHATNVAILFILLRRLVDAVKPHPDRASFLKTQLAIAAVTLIFAVHPMGTETVAEITYSADLLVTFFTLLALLAATAFQPGTLRQCLPMGLAGVFCSFASITCKESGLATSFILVAYWFLFRRSERKTAWLLFLGAAIAVAVAFVAALPEVQIRQQSAYLGGSWLSVFWIQPRLWVFMMGKLIWPTLLSGQYTSVNLQGISVPGAITVLIIVIALQAWLTLKTPLGALGVAIYWLALAPVSNFVPLFLPVADRFYYLPLASLAMQILSLLLLAMRSPLAFKTFLIFLFAASAPLSILALDRQKVFATELVFWSDTVQKSPNSSTSHDNLGNALIVQGRLDEAIVQFQQAVTLSPHFANAHDNLGNALAQRGRLDEAITQYEAALKIKPDSPAFHYNLGLALRKDGHLPEAVREFQEAIRLKAGYMEAQRDLRDTSKQLPATHDN